MRSAFVVAASLGAASAASADPPRFVLSTNAVEIARETYGLALDYRISEHVALRGDLGYDSRRYYDSSNAWDYKGGMKGAFGVLAFLGAPYKGAFADIELRMRTFETHEICNTGPFDPTANYCDDGWTAWAPQAAVGWQHTFDFAVSLAASVGIGYERTSRDDGQVSDGAAFYFGSVRIGVAF